MVGKSRVRVIHLVGLVLNLPVLVSPLPSLNRCNRAWVCDLGIGKGVSIQL